MLTHLPQLFAQAKNKRVTVFMDYDGTLTPIVKDPDRAFMSDQMRGVVKAVARLFPTAIISGRGREKVEAFVKLKELFYAGSHGMDIVGPKLEGCEDEALSFQAAAKFAPIMDKIFDDLVERTNSIPGASVEHNKFCVSVHFRNCEPERLEEVIKAVEAVLAMDKELKATRGRKVLEVRPEVEWNKGHALNHLLDSLALEDTSDVMPIYIGDDRTDEDAFAVLNHRDNGVGILVSTKVKKTEAVYRVRDPTEVMTFLTSLVRWGQSSENAWHHAQGCSGWRLNPEISHLEPPQPEGSGYDSVNIGENDTMEMARRRSRGLPPLFPPDHRPRCQPSTPGAISGGQSSLERVGPMPEPSVHCNGAAASSTAAEVTQSVPSSQLPASPFAYPHPAAASQSHNPNSAADPQIFAERTFSISSVSESDNTSTEAHQGSDSGLGRSNRSLKRIVLEVAETLKDHGSSSSKSEGPPVS